MSSYWICWLTGTTLIILSWLDIVSATVGWVGLGIALTSTGLAVSPRLFGHRDVTSGDAKMKEDPWQENARQQRITDRQLEESERQQQIAQKQLEESERQQRESQQQIETSRLQMAEKQRQLESSGRMLALEEANAQRIAQLVEIYAELAKRLNVVVSKWEQ